MNLAKWVNAQYEIYLKVKEKISPVLSKIGKNLKSFVGKTWSITIKAVDFITSPIRNIISLLKNPVLEAGVLGVQMGTEDLMNEVESLKLSFAERMAPLVKELADFMKSFLPAIKSGMNLWTMWS